MSEKPIIFSAPMVRALLDGRKTQTRRVLKARGLYETHPSGELVPIPRYAVGDRLWVRENIIKTPAGLAYAADGGDHYGAGGRLPITPSIHMPRSASRLTLTVTDVRVQRLREITREDARAEGVGFRDGCWGIWNTDGTMRCGGPDDPREAFRCLWTNIHGNGSWEANPWIVALTFTVALPHPERGSR